MLKNKKDWREEPYTDTWGHDTPLHPSSMREEKGYSLPAPPVTPQEFSCCQRFFLNQQLIFLSIIFLSSAHK